MMREVEYDLDWREQMADKRREDEPQQPKQPTQPPTRPEPSKPPVKPQGDIDNPGRQDPPPTPPHP